MSKGNSISKPTWNLDINVFPAKIWNFKIIFLIVFAIKMLLDNTYGLPNLFDFKRNHFNSLFQAEYQFKNSNFGGKYIDVKISCQFWNWIAFSHNTEFFVKSNFTKIFVKLIYLISISFCKPLTMLWLQFSALKLLVDFPNMQKYQLNVE